MQEMSTLVYQHNNSKSQYVYQYLHFEIIKSLKVILHRKTLSAFNTFPLLMYFPILILGPPARHVLDISLLNTPD